MVLVHLKREKMASSIYFGTFYYQWSCRFHIIRKLGVDLDKTGFRPIFGLVLAVIWGLCPGRSLGRSFSKMK